MATFAALACLAGSAVALAVTPRAGSFNGSTAQDYRLKFSVERGNRGSNLRNATVHSVVSLVRLRCAGPDRTIQLTPRQRYAVRNSRFSGHGTLRGGFRYEISGQFLRENNARGSVKVTGTEDTQDCTGRTSWRAIKTPTGG